MNSDPLVTMFVGGIVAAFLFGFIAHKLGLPPITGYLLAGAAIGPYTTGFVADSDLAGELADLGVILIMFGVGLRFSPAKLAEYRWMALPSALGQTAIVTAIGASLGALLGMPLLEGAIFGFSLSVASTLVLLRALEDRRETSSPAGRLAVSWLIVHNVTAVLILVAMQVLATGEPAGATGSAALLSAIAIKAAGLGAFVLALLAAARRILPGLLVFIARTRSRELFSLGVFSLALGIAYTAHAGFGASFALGAFLAGVVLNETDISHRAAEDLIPLREAFAVLFFVSVGMLFNPEALIAQSWVILAILTVIVLGNGAAAWLMLTLMRTPPALRATLASGLAQIGEFSFLIGSAGLALGLISESTHAYITAGAFLAIVLNPALRYAVRWLFREQDRPEETDAPNSA